MACRRSTVACVLCAALFLTLASAPGSRAAGVTFAPASQFSAGAGATSVATGDFNRDGKPDLATANNGANNISVLLGNGAGGFAAPKSDGVLLNAPTSVAVGDFNRDGKHDLAVANHQPRLEQRLHAAGRRSHRLHRAAEYAHRRTAVVGGRRRPQR